MPNTTERASKLLLARSLIHQIFTEHLLNRKLDLVDGKHAQNITTICGGLQPKLKNMLGPGRRM